MSDIIQIRGGTASDWSTANPILAHREVGIEMGSPNKMKIGDGVTAWNSLGYFASAGGGAWGSITGTITAQTDLVSYVSGMIEIASTFATISASTNKRLVYVTADENNNGDISLYLHTGTILKFLQTVS